MDEIQKRGAVVNRRRFIYDVVPPTDIKSFQKANKSLTKTEKFMSGFLLSCVRYGYIKSYKTQQIIQLGSSEKFIMADFFLEWPEVIIEVDGFEHISYKDKERDAEVQRLFAYETIRITNEEIRTNNRRARIKLVSALAKAEGLNNRQIKLRVKEYLGNQQQEGFGTL